MAATAVVLESMPERARELLGSTIRPPSSTIREEWELESGTIAGSEHVSDGRRRARGSTRSATVTSSSTAHTATGRSGLAKAMQEHGFEDVVSLAGRDRGLGPRRASRSRRPASSTMHSVSATAGTS
jgi:hypothetical protein